MGRAAKRGPEGLEQGETPEGEVTSHLDRTGRTPNPPGVRRLSGLPLPQASGAARAGAGCVWASGAAGTKSVPRSLAVMTRLAVALAAAALACATAPCAQAQTFDPAAEQVRQSAAVRSLQAGAERTAEQEQGRARAASAKPGDAEAARKTAEARAQTPEGRMEAQAEVERDEAQPRVVARAAAIRSALVVQPDRTGRRKGAEVGAAERQARTEAKRSSPPGLDLPPR